MPHHLVSTPLWCSIRLVPLGHCSRFFCFVLVRARSFVNIFVRCLMWIVFVFLSPVLLCLFLHQDANTYTIILPGLDVVYHHRCHSSEQFLLGRIHFVSMNWFLFFSRIVLFRGLILLSISIDTHTSYSSFSLLLLCIFVLPMSFMYIYIEILCAIFHILADFEARY